jgi:antitoxin (DNA-binding transcriptional repressor) of toxin-antitoxin stability system
MIMLVDRSMKASVVDLRYRMKDVLKAIDRGETVTVVYRGKLRARISPLADKLAAPKLHLQEAFGLWKDRKDLRDVGAYVRSLRRPRDLRH